ncbi:hypothetical protein BDN71DRAFT_1223469 [Pleurotus eryngii]|uniref:Outer spore wall protein RRT8 n=1 Tax=Pleurotus eryngii TaxID=5323 RepID=A0A9P6D5V0_PLEER|nr:hypothetical protein BDN71DRAFT_1223469 [Pleurotus eryngii]
MMSNEQSSISKIGGTIPEEINHASVAAKEAVLSGGWYYPLYGVVYFISHPSLYRSVAPLMLKSALASLGITIGMFTFTFLPQVAFCALFSGPLAFVAAFALVLSESSAIILLVAKAFLLGPTQDRLFDAVMVQQGHADVVQRGREVKSSNGVKTLGKSITRPLGRFSKARIIRYIISLPLNALPFIGTALFLLYNGNKAGPGFHARYFQLKGWTASQKQQFIQREQNAYTAFGAVSLALGLIPFAGLAFGFTSMVGAALWASSMERQSGTSVDFANIKPIDERSEMRVNI